MKTSVIYIDKLNKKGFFNEEMSDWTSLHKQGKSYLLSFEVIGLRGNCLLHVRFDKVGIYLKEKNSWFLIAKSLGDLVYYLRKFHSYNYSYVSGPQIKLLTFNSDAELSSFVMLSELKK